MGTSQNCPGSGTGTQTFNYTYTMSSCEDTPDGVSVTLTGTAVYAGSVTVDAGLITSIDEVFSSSETAISVVDPAAMPVDETCSFGITAGGDGRSVHAGGVVCGVALGN